MDRVRASFRFILLVMVTSWYYGVWNAGRPFHRSSAEDRRRWRTRQFRRWSKRTLMVLGARLRCDGEPPAGPLVLACNHLSYVDILVLASRMETVFVSKAEVERWPFVGRLARDMGTIFVDRRNKRAILQVNETMRAALESGENVVLFPEGTSTRGETIDPFRPSLLEPAVRSAFPVAFASLSYAALQGEPPASQTVCWWGDMPFFGHLTGLLRLSGFEATLTFGREALLETDRKVLADRLWRAVHARFVPVRQTS